MMVTLMACYGGPMDETPQEAACADSVVLSPSGPHASGTTRGVGPSGLSGSCAPAALSESFYRFSTGGDGEKPGTLTVAWTSVEPVAVHVHSNCFVGRELSCESAAQSGKLELHTKNFPWFLVAIASEKSTSYDIDIQFTPCADNDEACAALAEQ